MRPYVSRPGIKGLSTGLDVIAYISTILQRAFEDPEHELSNASIKRARALAQGPRKQVESRPQLPFQSMGEPPTPWLQWATSEASHSGVKVSFGAPENPRAQV